MRRWQEKEENYPRTEVRGFGKEYCRVVTRVHPDPLVKLVKTRRNSLLRKEVNLQTCVVTNACDDVRFLSLDRWHLLCNPSYSDYNQEGRERR
jgi:hypothetical protein